MFIPPKGEHRTLQPNDRICWRPRNHCVWFQDDQGAILRPTEVDSGYKVDFPCLEKYIDFASLAFIVAMACDLIAVAEGKRRFRFASR